MDRVKFECPKCRAGVLAPPSLEGEDMTCPKCGQNVERWPPPLKMVPKSAKPSRTKSTDEDDSDPVDDEYLDETRPRRSRREYDRRPNSSFGTAFGLSTGCLLGVLSVLVGVPLLLCGGCLMLGGLLKKSLPPVETSNEETPDMLKNIGEEARFGALGVTLANVSVGNVSGTSPSGRQLTSSDLLFIIRLQFKNYDPNAIAKVEGQSNATLQDEHGNKYKPMSITTEVGIPAKIDGQISSGHYVELRSDEMKSDVLVFERPVPGAASLTLTLDAKKYGGSGKLKITIPRSAWDKK